MSTQEYPEPLAPLEPWLNDPDVLEIMVNGYDSVYVERSGRLEKVPTPFRDDEHVLEVINAIVTPLGRRVDESTPMVDARLSDGSRVNAVIPPISLTGPTLTIRNFLAEKVTIEDIIRFESMSEDMIAFLQACVRGRLNIVVAGGTGSGKTTVLNRIVEMIPDNERIILVQNADEMQISKKRLVKLESRPPNIEGKGEVTIRDLVINSLRMRPDRIIVGEVRWAEAIDVLQAMNTGHDGTMFSIHASSPRDALTRLETMVLMANPSLPLLKIRQQIASAVDLITYQERLHDGSRKMLHVTEVLGLEGDALALQDIFEYRQIGFKEGRVTGHHTATGVVPKFFNRFREWGIELPISLFTPK
jgi:pilus assembly protein CpaF